MSGYIKTMKDLEAATYGIRGGAGNSMLKAAGIVGGLHTAHDAGTSVMSGLSGVDALYNVLYGQKVWSMLNQEANALAMLSKRPYTSSGWRIMTERAAGGTGNTFTLGSGAEGAAAPDPSTMGGVAENAALVTDIPAIAPAYSTLFTSPKTVAHLFDFSELAIEMAKIDDGVGDLRALIREDMGKHHAEVQNVMLLTPLEHYGNTTTQDNIGRNYTSLMKIVSSSAELLEMADSTMFSHVDNQGDDATLRSELVKLYGSSARQLTDASTATASFMDATVDFGTDYVAASARVLTLTILNNMIRRLREAGGSPKVILTGYDTIQHIGDLLQAQERFLERKEVVPTHNGVRGIKGREVGFRVATYFDIPIIPCKDMPSTGNGSNKLSDLLLLDTDHLWLSVMKPTQYFEDGIDNGNPFGVGVLGNRGMYRTIAETGCSFFKGQGKITNVTSA